MHFYLGTVLAQNFFALLPLALVLGEVTEDLALRFGDIVGGLLNATFGNVVRCGALPANSDVHPLPCHRNACHFQLLPGMHHRH
jgi:hypothetical protein